MSLTKAQVLKIRQKADDFLKKMNSDEKNEYKSLAGKYEQVNTELGRITDLLRGNTTSDKVLAALKVLKVDLGKAINSARPDMSEVIKSINA